MSMNIEQSTYWNGPAGLRWVEHQAALDRALKPFGQAALERAAVQPGERILDVGCGCGDSVVALSAKAGSSGHVIGVDLSAPMLALARQRLEARDNVELIEADASSLPNRDDLDLVFSRFGVMFFDDPVGAFSQLRAALHRGGRLVFVCWRGLTDNPWTQLPTDVVREVWPEAPPPITSNIGPGPLSLADSAEISRVLSAAGYSSLAIERFDSPVVLSTGGLDEAVDFAMNAGPATRMLADAAPAIRDAARQRLAAVLAPHRSDVGYTLAGSCWVVSANA
jgi:SAM-dependent methyltransferase